MTSIISCVLVSRVRTTNDEVQGVRGCFECYQSLSQCARSVQDSTSWFSQLVDMSGPEEAANLRAVAETHRAGGLCSEQSP